MLPIVIVDDSVEDAELAQRVLLDCKVRNPLVLLRSGQACLDYFYGEKEFQTRPLPSLVLLDLAMSPMSGIAVQQKLQRAKVSKGSIFVMLSGLSDMRAIRKGYQLGAVTLLIKSLNRDDVMQMLDKIKGIRVVPHHGGYVLELEEVARLLQR